VGIGSPPLPKICHGGGGPGFDPHRLHKILNTKPNQKMVPRGSPCLGHVAPPHLPKNATCQNMIHPTCVCQSNLPIITCHIIIHHIIMPHQCTCATSVIRPCHVSTDCTDCTVSQQFFFACLANRTERDISLIRCLFDPVRSALGS
jgi:hypothetical protein